MGSILDLPLCRRHALKAPAGFVPSPQNFLRLIAANQQPKEGQMLEFPARGAHFLDRIIEDEKQAKAERSLSRESRKSLMRFAMKELLSHNQKQFAVFYDTVVLGNSVESAAERVDVTPAAISGYRRRALGNIHTIYKKAEGAIRG